MTVLGIALVLVGSIVGLTGSTSYNGQWLLGLMIALTGVALCAIHTITTKEKK